MKYKNRYDVADNRELYCVNQELLDSAISMHWDAVLISAFNLVGIADKDDTSEALLFQTTIQSLNDWILAIGIEVDRDKLRATYVEACEANSILATISEEINEMIETIGTIE